MPTTARRRAIGYAGAAAAILIAAATVVTVVRLSTPSTVEAAAAPGADAFARAKARTTGGPVTVDGSTTAFSTTVANPDGSFTFTGHAMPTSTRRNGTWVPIDSTLRPQADGTLAPAAVDGSVRISGGGRTPVSAFDDRTGHTFTVGVTVPLPAPTVAGATARYRSVLPGVDLAVTATASGGTRQVFVVHDAAAAANPALHRLVLPVGTVGLTLRRESDGVISAVDTLSGKAVFAASPPVMWDSTLPGGVTAAAPTDLTGDGDRLASSIDGPGVAAARTVVPADVADAAIVLAPPVAALTGPGVTYPVFIDPPFGPVAAPNDAYVESFHPNVTDYNPTDDLRVGYDDWTTGCGGSPCYQNGITRSYLTFPGVGGLNGKHITNALLQLNQLRSSCTGTSAWINASITNNNSDFGPGLTWNNQPGPSGVTGSTWMPGGSVGGQQIDLLGVANYAFSNGYQTLNLAMWASNESDHCVYRHFGLNPSLVVNYISQPNAPASLVARNGTAQYPCTTTSPGPWLSAASANQITLNDSVSSPDASDALTAHFYLSANGGAAADTPVGVTETSSNTPIAATTTVTLTDGTAYAWYATASNSALTSPVSSTCYLRYDASLPSAPVATSTTYPPNGPTTVTAGGSGTIALSSTDTGSGIASYNYNINGASLTAAGEQNTTNASLPIPVQGLRWGTNIVWIQAVDRAGNLSSVSSYSFFVQQSAFGAYTPGTAGDVDGDNRPDLVTVDTAGAIHLYSAPDTFTPNPTGNLTDDPNQYGGKVLIAPTSNARWPMPDSASAAGALVTHGGSFTGNNYDDLLVEQNGHLAIATNPGTGGTWTFATTDVTKPPCASCANYNNQDWSSVTQMIAMAVGPAARPDLLTVEVVNGTGTLWLYTPKVGSYAYNAPVVISADTSAWHWDDTQLVSAGPLRGTTGTTLWIKQVSTYQLYLFHNIEAGIADPASAKIAIGSPLNLYGLVTTVGQADSNGALPVWATNFSRQLVFFPTYTSSSGVTTMYPEVAVSNSGWASHHIAFGSSYFRYNNSGVGNDGQPNDAYDAYELNGTNAYSANAMANATMNPDAIVNDGGGGCPTGWTVCAAGVGAANTIFMPRGDGTFNAFTMPSPWAHRNDNYISQGQILPVPTPGTSGPAHTIRFLGSATTFSSTGASVPITINYTNGHTQTMTLTFGDWSSPVIAGNTVVATMDHRLTSTTGASQTIPSYLFMNSETTLLDNGNPLGPNVQIASISLGVNTLVHIFSIAIN